MVASKNRLRGCIALAAITGMLVIGASSGAGLASAAAAPDPPFYVQAQNGTLTITGTSAKDIATIDTGLLRPQFDGITIRAGKLLFGDARLAAGPGCVVPPGVDSWIAICIAPFNRIVMNGNDGWDRLWNNSSLPAVISGGSGNDYLLSRGSAQILGGAGNDNIKAGEGGTAFMAWPFKNDLQGGDGKDTIDGSLAADAVIGGAGVDNIKALAGNDIVDVRDGGKDNVNCGNSNDMIRVDSLDKHSACESLF